MGVFVDMFYLDVSVIVSLLAAQHYWFACCMASIFVSTIVLELWNGHFQHLREDVLFTHKTGIMAERIHAVLSCERGWEAFFQLMVTTYSLPFLSRSDILLI